MHAHEQCSAFGIKSGKQEEPAKWGSTGHMKLAQVKGILTQGYQVIGIDL